MELKFQENYDTLKQLCPPKNYQAKQMTEVFRWVFEDINDERNFESQYHKNPKRFQLKSDKEKCQALALSMFYNKNGAKERFSELFDDMGSKIYQTIGNRIAKGIINEEDGVNGNIERLGHFNHHPALKTDYSKIFQILEEEKL